MRVLKVGFGVISDMSASESGVPDDAVVAHQGECGTFVLASVSGADEWIEADAEDTMEISQ